MKTASVMFAGLVAACGGKSHEAEIAPLPPEQRATPGTKINVPSELASNHLFVSDVDGLSLFEAEQLEAAQIIEQWAESQGLHIEDPVRTRKIFARATRGQNVETGAACGAPLWRTTAISRWRDKMNALGRIETGVYCTPTCWLDVRLTMGLDAGLDDGPTAFYAAPYDPSQPWRTELAKRLGELIAWQAPGEPNDPIAAVPGAKAMPAVTDPVLARGSRETGDLPTALLAPARQCLALPAPAAGILVQTSANGTVEQCEPYDRLLIANVAAGECICKTIAGKSIGGGARREPIDVFLDEVRTVTKAGMIVNANAEAERAQDPMTSLWEPVTSDPAIREWEPPQSFVLAPCFDAATENLDFPVQLTFARDGHVTAVVVKKGTGTVTPAMESCVHDKFMAVRAPCPESESSTANAEVRVQLAKP